MHPPIVDRIVLPPASMGTTRLLKAIRYGHPGRGPKAYIQAGLHADEAPALLVVHHLMRQLDRAQADGDIIGEIVLVPVANPIGLGQWRDDLLRGRFDFYDGTNFNRQYPDIAAAVACRIAGQLGGDAAANVALIRQAARTVLGEIVPQSEADSLKHRLLSLAVDADIVLDLHCDDQALVHVYLGTSLWPSASALSAQLGAAVTLLADDSGVTPFDEACSRIWFRLKDQLSGHPIPPACLAATVEFRGQADVDHGLAATDARNLFVFLQRRGVIGGPLPDLPVLAQDATPLAAVAQIKATAPGVVVFRKHPGDRVVRGEVIAEVVNPLADAEDARLQSIVSPTDGLLFARKCDRYARPGRILAKVAGTVPLKKAGENLLTL